MTPQQQMFLQEMEKELGRMTMSWDNELREWYEIAMKALNHASVQQLNVVQANYPRVFETDYHGINMHVVTSLCNNLEMVKPAEMGMTAVQWKDVIELNIKIAQRWENLVDPIRATVRKRVELIGKKGPKIIAPLAQA